MNVTPSVAIDNVKKSQIPLSSGNTLYVGGNDEGNYTKIQYAIQNASDGDTIFVYKGIYYENVVIGKSITLVGEERDSTIIDAGRSGSVIHIRTENVTISEFTIQNSGEDEIDSGILIYHPNHPTHYNNIFNNILIGNNWGIYIIDADYNTISGNIIKANDCGIILEPYAIPILINPVYQPLSTCHNNVCDNDISNNQYGIILSHCSNNNIFENNLTWNECSINIYANHGHGGAENNIYLNNIIKNLMGICMDGFDVGPRNNDIYQNNFINNWKGISILIQYTEESCNNRIYHNNFINNVVNARDWKWKGNFWDDGSEGNYWNRYIGRDGDGDGIGDRPCRISPYFTANKDRYPLMEPYADVPDVTIKAINNMPRTRASSYFERFPMLERLLGLIR